MAADTPDTKPEEYGYTIDGKIYPEPESLTIDDHRIVKRYTGFNFRELAGMSNDALYVDQDGIAAIMHISYRHAHEDMSFDEIAEIVGRQNLDVAQSTLEAAEKTADGEVPLDPESTPQPDGSSLRSIDGKAKASGTSSSESSDLSEDPPGTTGTPESDTPTGPSDPETEAA